MKNTIVIDDADATLNPAYPWTAAAYDESGVELSNPGFGLSRQEAVLDLLNNVQREHASFRQPLLPTLNPAQTDLVKQARFLMAQNGAATTSQHDYRRGIIDLVTDALTIEGVGDSDDRRMLVERMLQ